jgi:hypothetical protein
MALALKVAGLVLKSQPQQTMEPSCTTPQAWSIVEMATTPLVPGTIAGER